jgi:hypothetical protein
LTNLLRPQGIYDLIEIKPGGEDMPIRLISTTMRRRSRFTGPADQRSATSLPALPPQR